MERRSASAVRITGIAYRLFFPVGNENDAAGLCAGSRPDGFLCRLLERYLSNGLRNFLSADLGHIRSPPIPKGKRRIAQGVEKRRAGLGGTVSDVKHAYGFATGTAGMLKSQKVADIGNNERIAQIGLSVA